RGEAHAETSGKRRRGSRGRPGRGACGLLDAAAGVAGSLLAHFPDRVEDHRDPGCPACAGAAPGDGRRFTVPVP
ncbi:NADH-ubiquinone oxidoreductase-F iron-sulfur binding region domain-containing protein, partial [Streptomyces sp. 900105245]